MMELTTKQCETLAKAIRLGETGYEDGWEDDCVTAADQFVAVTRDELAAFDGSGWAEATGREGFEVDGHPAVHFESVQVQKGDRRGSLTVVDFGDFRAAWHVA